MAGTIDARLTELGIELPEAAASVANYIPHVVTGNYFVSGQVPFWNGALKGVGKVGRDMDVPRRKRSRALGPEFDRPGARRL